MEDSSSSSVNMAESTSSSIGSKMQIREPLATLSKWKMPGFLVSFLKSVGYGFVPELAQNLKKFKHDYVLTSLLIDYYNSEENCFIFNQERLYIGLIDVYIGTGLQVHGKAAICKLKENWKELCLQSFGHELPDAAFDCKKGKPNPKLRLTWLRSHGEALLKEGIEEGTDKWKIYIRCFWMHFIGCYIAPDSSNMLVSVHYLGLLENVKEIGQYAWGAASWTKLVRGLKEKKVNTLVAFLVVFMLEHIQPLRNKILEKATEPFTLPTGIPLLSRWGAILAPVFLQTVQGSHAEIALTLRNELDSLTAVVHNPYRRLALHKYNGHLMSACRDTVCFHLCDVEVHKPSVFHMQYGYRTLAPFTELPLKSCSLARHMGKKEDVDVFLEDKFKPYLVAWDSTDRLKGELLDGWSAREAPWLVEEKADGSKTTETEKVAESSNIFNQHFISLSLRDDGNKTLSKPCDDGSSVHASPDGSKTLSRAHGTRNVIESPDCNKGGEDYESEIKTPASSSQSLHTIDTRVQDCTGVRCKNAIPVELLLKNNTDRSPLKKKGKKK